MQKRKNVIKKDAALGAKIGGTAGLFIGGMSAPVLIGTNVVPKLFGKSPAAQTAGVMAGIAGSTLGGAALGGTIGAGVGSLRKYNPKYKLTALDKKEIEKKKKREEKIMLAMDKEIGRGVLLGLGAGALLGVGLYGKKVYPILKNPVKRKAAFDEIRLTKISSPYSFMAKEAGKAALYKALPASTIGGGLGLGYYFVKAHNRKGKVVKGFQRKNKKKR